MYMCMCVGGVDVLHGSVYKLLAPSPSLCLSPLSFLPPSLSPGGGLSMAQKDNCWEKVEVSSNSHRSSRILDNDSSTYWESTGRSGSHWLRLYMKKGLIIKYAPALLNTSPPHTHTSQSPNTFHTLHLPPYTPSLPPHTLHTFHLITTSHITHHILPPSLSPSPHRKLRMDVNPSDSSYMPQRITVQGGVAPDRVEDLSTVCTCIYMCSETETTKITKIHVYPQQKNKLSFSKKILFQPKSIAEELDLLSSLRLWMCWGNIFIVTAENFSSCIYVTLCIHHLQVYIPSTFLGEFELLKNCRKHYPVIVLRIKRSQQVLQSVVYGPISTACVGLCSELVYHYIGV